MSRGRRLSVCFYTEKSNWAGDFKPYSIFNSDVLTEGVILIFRMKIGLSFAQSEAFPFLKLSLQL